MLHLDYRDIRPIYAQIVDGVREEIRAGILQEGDRLPSVREQAAQLAINPNTIQRAYRELEASGEIATVPGKGCFVCSPREDTPQELLEEFDHAVSALIQAGVSPEKLIQRIQKGGIPYAPDA